MTSLSLFFGLLMTVSNFTSTTVTTRPLTMQDAVIMSREELKFVELVNKERESRGLEQLTIDPLLVRVAREHSREMGEKGYFDHHSPTPGRETAVDRYLATLGKRPTWALIGENLFYCSIVDVSRGHVALMRSDGHRTNILEPRFRRIGVGAFEDSQGQFYVTQMFLAKID